MMYRPIDGGAAPPVLKRVCPSEVAARLAAMAYVGWGGWTLAVVHGPALGPPDAGAVTAALMSFIALQAIGVGALLVWHGSRVGLVLNGAAVTWAQLGTCILTPYAWLPSGFVGPLLWAIAGLASVLATTMRPSVHRFFQTRRTQR